MSFLFLPILCGFLIFTLTSFLCLRTFICPLRSSSMGGARVMLYQGGEWDLRSEKKRNKFARVGTNIFWHTIYFYNPKTNPDSQYESLPHKGLGRWAPWIIEEYNLANAIGIWPLTHPCTCKLGSYIFTAMKRLTFVCRTWDSLPSIPLPDRTNGENVSVTCDNDHSSRIYYLSTTNPVVISLDPFCGYHNMRPPVWRQWWHTSSSPVGPGQGRQILFLKWLSLDIPETSNFGAPPHKIHVV